MADSMYFCERCEEPLTDAEFEHGICDDCVDISLDAIADVASDWNLDEVEIDGEMQDIGDVRDIFRDWLAQQKEPTND